MTVSESAKVPTLSISFISDKYMGLDQGWASLYSNQLLATYPEINFDFRFFHVDDFSDKEMQALQSKKLVAHNADHIIMGLDRPNLNEFLTEFLERLPKKTHGQIWMLNIPKVVYGADFDIRAEVDSKLAQLKNLCTSEQFHWVDPTDYFQMYISQQIEKEGNLHALHRGEGELTQLGQLLLSEFFKVHISV